MGELGFLLVRNDQATWPAGNAGLKLRHAAYAAPGRGERRLHGGKTLACVTSGGIVRPHTHRGCHREGIFQ
jgi:hypothetical protein